MLASRAIINWLHFLGGAKGVKSQPIWGVVCYSFSAGNRAMHLEDLRGCLDDNRVTFAWARVHSCSLSRLYICLHNTPQNVMPAWVTPAWAYPGCFTRARISLQYHVNSKQPLILVWNRSAGRLERVAHALFLWFWITHVFEQHVVYLQIMRYRDYFMVGECVRFLFTSCEESKTNEWAQRTSEFAILHNKWIKIVQANQPWSYLFIL